MPTGVIDKNLPSRKLNKKKFTIPRDRRILMRKRKKISKKNSQTNKQNKTKQNLIDIELLLQESHKREREKAEFDATSKIKTNSKYFFSYAKRFSKTKPKIGPLVNPATKNLTSNSQEMADILQNQYCSVFTPPKSDNSLLDSNQTEETTPLEVKLTPLTLPLLLDLMDCQQYSSKCVNHPWPNRWRSYGKAISTKQRKLPLLKWLSSQRKISFTKLTPLTLPLLLDLMDCQQYSSKCVNYPWPNCWKSYGKVTSTEEPLH